MSGEDAMYELTVDLPTLPKGEPVQIVGLGTFENKGTYIISKDEAEAYRQFHKTQEDVRDDEGNVTGTRVVLGDTLLQVSKNMYGVEVSSTDSGDKQKGQQKSVTNSGDTAKTQKNTGEPTTIGTDDGSAKGGA